jgi:hypothetical protein
MIIKYAAALLLTLLICPGIGHLVLRQFKKSLLIFGCVFAAIAFGSVLIFYSIDPTAIPRDPSLIKNYLMNLISKDNSSMLMMDIAAAALYSFAVIDIVFSFIKEYKSSKKKEV